MVGWGARTGSHALLREEAAVGLIGLARPAVGPGAPEEEKRKVPADGAPDAIFETAFGREFANRDSLSAKLLHCVQFQHSAFGTRGTRRASDPKTQSRDRCPCP
jgi:hypothetical protein